MKRFLLAILLTGFVAVTQAREVFSLNDNWKFYFKSETSADNALNVSIPHTWNLDALAGQGQYLQTMGNYTRDIYIPAEWSGKRLFIKFHGVQCVTDVYINGHHVGEHRGGWTAFAFEITKHINFGKNNTITVSVSNAYFNDVLPGSSELNFYGGIYRDVELIVTNPTTISPMYYGSDGILIHQSNITDNSVDVTASVWVTTLKDKSCDLEIIVRSPEGAVVYSDYVRARIEQGSPISIPFTIDEPLMWSPDEPNLYTVSIGIGLRHEDVVTVRTGFRKIDYGPKGLSINGQRIDIHGVTMYHDRSGVASALQTRHYDEDLEQIIDLGANAVRSSTAPHAQYFYDKCDEQGLLVWIDTPFTRAPFLSDISYTDTERFRNNGIEQLKEIIVQNYNHPSVVMWGIFSLVKPRGSVIEFVRTLNSTAKSLDSTRPTVASSNHDGDINYITDMIVWQQDLGWQRGRIDDVAIWQDMLFNSWGHLASAVIYGQNGSIDQQTDEMKRPDRIDKRWYPECWQTAFHEGYARHLSNDKRFWGVWINDMFDFGSSRYTYGISHRGLVTFDRKDKKDAYYLYRSLWNKKTPTLHISNKRHNIRQDSVQVVKFYSSAPQKPLLIVNKDTVATREYAPCQFISDTIIMHGTNRIKVTAGDLTDEQKITIGNALKRRQ
ncbi:MAG: glycoside hydrolase family 2 TIM barrel-domain containing protein [Alistipes sp.]|nr:glycoside hydrolase family 2 TIM barrel-domain containing protein [Alistipes sp.]